MLQNVKKLFSNSIRSKKKLSIMLTSFVVVSAVLSFTVYTATQASVSLTIDGKKEKLRTHADTVGELLKEQDIKVRDEDYLSHTLSASVNSNMNVIWEPAKPIELVVDNQKKNIWTTADTIKEVLANEKINISKHDQVQPDLDTSIKENLTVQVSKAFPVKLNQGGNEQKVWSTSTTVADFLKQQEIKLDDLDRVDPSLSSLVTPNAVVSVVRVEKVTDVVEEPVGYAVVTKNDPSLEKGNEKVVSEGIEGRIAKHYEVTVENGKEISRKLVKTEQLKQSKDRVVAVGSKLVKPVAQTAAVQVSRDDHQGAKEFYVRSTAYTAFCNGCSGKTKTGINLRANPNAKVIAVDPNVIPLGSKVYVEGYGYAIAGDTGGAIKGNKIDVFFADKSQAYRWGRRTVKIKVLN
ncbi:G5 and 3D domain-containing protein [Priestia abyssalis]|uniref:G5 and 3D domain-containing protein n=1 Tax=Priestia abyssalis TaxID=1221450 RepID=UPI000995C0B7|nr:G5 and 3D domain-containing protein [Priestia abyssalis]